MMKARGYVAWTVALLMILSAAALADADDVQNVQVTVDGTAVTFEAPILMADMIVPLLPAEQFLGAVGATVAWDAAAQQLNVQRGDDAVRMWVGRDWADVNGERQNMAFSLSTFNGAPYVPGPATARLLGLDVGWDAAGLTLALASPQPPPAETIHATLYEVADPEPPTTLVVRRLDDRLVRQVQLQAAPSITRGRQDGEASPVALAALQPGDLLELGLDEDGTARIVRATYAQALGTIATIRDNTLTLERGDSFPLGEGAQAAGSDGTPLHLLGAEGEAAILRLSPASGAVWGILAQRPGSPTPPETEAPRIACFVVPRYDRPLRGGESMPLRVVGSAGADTTVAIGGGAGTVPLAEAAPGVYQAAVEVPPELELAGNRLTARLTAGGRTAEARSNVEVTVDNSEPRVYNMAPPQNAVLQETQVTVSASYQDRGPAGIDPAGVVLTVDGADVTADADVTAAAASVVVELAAGEHTAHIDVPDLAGTVTTQTWQFETRGGGGPVVAVEHDAAAPLRAGDTLTVRLTVRQTGREATFDIAGVAEAVPMTRVEGENAYTGSYEVRAEDPVGQTQVAAHFVADDGTVHDALAAEPITISEPAPVELTITTPAEGEQAARHIRPAGTAPPGSRVRWVVEYQEFIVTGEVAGGTVTAAADSTWQADDRVDLKIVLIGMADRYSLTAEQLNAEGEVVAEEAVTFTARER